MRRAFEDTVGVPAGGLRPSLNHLIRPLQERRRDRQTERLGGLEVDEELELGGLLYREVGGPDAFEDLVDVQGSLPEHVIKIRAVRHEGARMGVLREAADGRKPALESNFGDLRSLREEDGRHEEQERFTLRVDGRPLNLGG
jgi:hypothetical protein